MKDRRYLMNGTCGSFWLLQHCRFGLRVASPDTATDHLGSFGRVIGDMLRRTCFSVSIHGRFPQEKLGFVLDLRIARIGAYGFICFVAFAQICKWSLAAECRTEEATAHSRQAILDPELSLKMVDHPLHRICSCHKFPQRLETCSKMLNDFET